MTKTALFTGTSRRYILIDDVGVEKLADFELAMLAVTPKI
jgi:hypothetical protein